MLRRRWVARPESSCEGRASTATARARPSKTQGVPPGSWKGTTMNLLTRRNWVFLSLVLTVGPASKAVAQNVQVDLSAYTTSCGVEVKRDGSRLLIGWPMDGGEQGRLTLDLRSEQPLIESLRIASGSEPETLIRGIEPLMFLMVGTRQAPPGRPPEMSLF